MTEEKKEESISEKVWEASMNERYQVSRMKDPMQPDEEIHVHKCNICPRNIKKPPKRSYLNSVNLKTKSSSCNITQKTNKTHSR